MRTLLPVLILSLAMAACNYGGRNPGGHTPDEIARAEQQPPPVPSKPAPAPVETASGGGNYDGQQLYTQYCSACHKEGKSGPPLEGVFGRRELPSGTPANDPRVKETIRLGRAMMPAFGGVLNDDQISAIVAYLHTM